MKGKLEKPLLNKQEAKTLLEKEFEKANHLVNQKQKEMNMLKYEKTVESSKLKGEEKVLEVKTKHLICEYDDKERENFTLKDENLDLIQDIDELDISVKAKIKLLKDKREELKNIKNNKFLELSNKKNSFLNVNENNKDEIQKSKTKLSQIIFSNQLKKEEIEKIKIELQKIEKYYQNVLSLESQGIKKATTIFKEMRDK